MTYRPLRDRVVIRRAEDDTQYEGRISDTA